MKGRSLLALGLGILIISVGIFLTLHKVHHRDYRVMFLEIFESTTKQTNLDSLMEELRYNPQFRKISSYVYPEVVEPPLDISHKLAEKQLCVITNGFTADTLILKGSNYEVKIPPKSSKAIITLEENFKIMVGKNPKPMWNLQLRHPTVQ